MRRKKKNTLLTDACLVERSQLSSLMSRISHRLGTWRAKTAAKLSHAFCFLVETILPFHFWSVACFSLRSRTCWLRSGYQEQLKSSFGVSKGTKKLHKCRKLEPSQANPNAISNTLLSCETCMVRYETFDAGTFSNDVQHFCKFNDIRYTCSARGLSFAPSH